MTYVSTGSLPRPDAVQAALDEAYARHRTDSEGEVSRVYPALERMPADLFGSASAAPRPHLRRRRRRAPIHDHERLQAIRVRARL